MELMKYYAESNRKMLERLRGKQREIAKRMRITNLEASDLIAKESAKIFARCNDKARKIDLQILKENHL